MKRNQLFKRKIPRHLVINLLKCFGLNDFNDKQKITFKKIKILNVLENIKKIKKELKKYYIPCKAKIYLNNITYKKSLTILRQCIKNFGYKLNSQEKYSNGEKYNLYYLKSINPLNYNLIDSKKNIKNLNIVVINFD